MKYGRDHRATLTRLCFSPTFTEENIQKQARLLHFSEQEKKKENLQVYIKTKKL